ncbi:MAG: hypothetical protein KGN02_11265 [bacterium]|nr:hypothetical protein [bacterium]
MRNTNLLRSLPAVALVGTLGIALLGVANPADSHFSTTAMKPLLQSIADAEAVQPNATGSVKQLAAELQKDELTIGDQLATISGYYNINVDTTMPKGNGDASAFVANQERSLGQLVGLFKQESSAGGAGQLRAYAAEALPILEKDLAAVKAAH